MSVAPMPELRGTGARKGPCRRGSRSRMRSARTYHWLYGDFGAWLTALRRRRVGAAALAAWALNMAWMSLRSHHLTFDWRDPLPTLGMYWKKFARPALRRLRGARPKPAAA